MGYYIGLGLLALAAILQSSLLNSVPLPVALVDIVGFNFNAQPNFVLMSVLAWSVHAEWEEAFFWAFIGGILQDLLAITPTGTSVIGLLVTVYAICALSEQLYAFNPLLLPIFAIAATVLQHIIIMGVLTAFEGITIDVLTKLELFTLPALLYNAVLVLPVYVILRRIQKRLPQRQSGY